MTEFSKMISVENVSRVFPVGRSLLGAARHKVFALDQVNIELRQGETLGLVGESGCGKSTLARLLVGLDKPTSGTVQFENIALNTLSASELKERRSKIQMVFQDPYASLNPRMTARASIAEPIGNFLDLSQSDSKRRVEQLAEQVGLSAHLLDRFPHELSGGQCQRVGIARAIAARPQVIIADEPVSALDVSIQAQILNLLFDIKEQMNLAMVFVSHDLSVVAHVADRVAVMYLGRIIETGPAELIFDSPKHPYTRMLLDSLPSPHPASRGRDINVKGELPSPIDPPAGCHFQSRCPLVGEVCKTIKPDLVVAENNKQYVACHFANQPLERKNV
jgi:oligopeptide/dipeptide ABC transporter ATP-binding protein